MLISVRLMAGTYRFPSILVASMLGGIDLAAALRVLANSIPFIILPSSFHSTSSNTGLTILTSLLYAVIRSASTCLPA